MGTRDAARDLDVLRAVLGDRQLTYLGSSYGTYLGATYAELFPRRVGRLVLDGAMDPATTSVEVARQQAIGFQRALGGLPRRLPGPVVRARSRATARQPRRSSRRCSPRSTTPRCAVSASAA